MLVEFRVANFRSIHEEQVLSFVASNDKTAAKTHLMDAGIKGVSQLTRTAVIYGPNASGKSSILSALAYLQQVVLQSANLQPGASFNAQPFKLSKASVKQPSRFEITFVLDGARHQYGFSISAERIVDEWLLVYRTAKPQQWFNRVWNEKTQVHDYEFSPHLTGTRKVWQEATRANALFLSTAVQLNSELLRPVLNWMTSRILFFAAGQHLSHDYTTELLKTDDGRNMVSAFLSAADTGIVAVQAMSRKTLRRTYKLDMAISGPAPVLNEEVETFTPIFSHTADPDLPSFELQDESQGTQRLYALAAPVLDALANGWMLVVDELDSSLHSYLVKHIVQMFHNPAINTKGAQLLFSTHDTSLLGEDVFRRDQIWFTEKDQSGATRLYPFSDFSPRKAEAWERGYLAGRYGAVPLLRSEPAVPSKIAA
ncbi:MAG: ATP-binding protein [Stagnimonas sp.]|nr:ATP-binding protein [Stagnimonas sp.]